MDGLETAMPGGAFGQPNAAGGTPSQSIGIPESQVSAPIAPAIDPTTGQPVIAAPAAKPEFQFQLPSGSTYRTVEDLARGATEKDFTIERYKAQIAELQSKVPQQQTQQQTQAQSAGELEALVRECEMELRNDPSFAGATDEQYRAQAKLDARVLYRAEQRTRASMQSESRQTQHAAFLNNTPELHTDLAHHIFTQAQESGMPFRSPQEHLNAVHAEMYRQGIPFNRPQAGGTQGVQGAVAQVQGQNRIFQPAQGGGIAPQSNGSISPLVRRQIEFAERQGIKGAELEAVRNRAIQNEAAFSR